MHESEYNLSCVGNLTEGNTCVWMSDRCMNTRNIFRLASSTILVMTWLSMSSSFLYFGKNFKNKNFLY
jgi:hypothetical protein